MTLQGSEVEVFPSVTSPRSLIKVTQPKEPVMIAKIEFTKPDGADIEDIATFIHDALSSWGGCFRPDDPLFHSLKLTAVTVHGKRFKAPEEPTT